MSHKNSTYYLKDITKQLHTHLATRIIHKEFNDVQINENKINLLLFLN